MLCLELFRSSVPGLVWIAFDRHSASYKHTDVGARNGVQGPQIMVSFKSIRKTDFQLSVSIPCL